MSKTDTGLFDALANKHGSTCQNHDALVEIIKGFDRRLKRLEIMGLVIMVAAGSLAGKLAVWPLLAKLAGI